MAYNARVEAYLRENGLSVEKGTNWAARTETDIMPSPADMKSPGEFARAAAYINGDGGNMYASPLAAEAQGKLDGGDPVSVAEGRAYAEEMKSRVDAMKREKSSLMKQYAASADPAERSFLAAEVRKADTHQAKYIDRINRLERSIGERARPSSPGRGNHFTPGRRESTGFRSGLQERGSGGGLPSAVIYRRRH